MAGFSSKQRDLARLYRGEGFDAAPGNPCNAAGGAIPQTAEAAAQWVKDFKPKVVYPYHTQGMPSGDVPKFQQLVGHAADLGGVRQQA